MARKGGRGGSSAARSAAAKKGWETRRRGGAKSKPAATKRTAASKAKAKPVRGGQAERAMARAQSKLTAAMQAKDKMQGRNKSKERLAVYKGGATWERYQKRFNKANRSHTTAWKAKEYLKAQQAAKPAAKTTARRGMPKTTSARGRALTNQRRAADLVRASRGGKGPSAKAVRSVLTAQRARAFYATTGGGKKRSAVKPAAKKATAAKAAAVRSRLGGGGASGSVRAKMIGRPAAQIAAKPKAKRGGKRVRVQTADSKVRALEKKSKAAQAEANRYQWNQQPYNPKNFFGSSKVRDANMAKASPETLAKFNQQKKEYDRWTRNRNKTAKASVEASNAAFYARRSLAKARPGIIRAESRAKATAARAKVAGRPRATSKVATRRSSGVNGAELTRRFSRLDNGPTDSRGNYTSASPATRRERQLRMETNPAKRTAMQRKLDRAIRTEVRAKAFRKAVAGVQGLGYGRVSATPQGQATMARNYANRPRFSTRQRIRPTWANGMRP